MGKSPIYRNAALYELVMCALYGRHYRARYRTVADLIPDQADVLELCCGTGHLYRRYLRQKAIRYRGVDMNRGFVARLQRQGVAATEIDLRSAQELPPADYVIMQAALYHFLPDPTDVVDRMLRAARQKVIVVEPVHNLAASNVPIVSHLARRYTNPGGGGHDHRFTELKLDQFFSRYSSQLNRSFLIPGGREKVFVFAVS